MITHRTKKKELGEPGKIARKMIEILAAGDKTRAEIIVDGKHEMTELAAGSVYEAPIWSARALVDSGKARFV